MAIFMENCNRVGQATMREVGDKMYIAGHGHTSTTFKPLYDDYLYAYGGVLKTLSSDVSRSFSSHQVVGTQQANYISGTLNSYTGQRFGGFKLRQSIKASDGFTYVTNRNNSYTANMLAKISPKGQVIDSASASQSLYDYSILFENDEYIFLVGGGETSTISYSTYEFAQLVAVRKRDMTVVIKQSANNLSTRKAPFTPSSSLGSTNSYTFQTSLIAYDEASKTASIAVIQTNNFGGIASYQVITLDGKIGSGTTYSSNTTATGDNVNTIGSYTIYSPKAGFDLSKSITGTNGKKYSYRVDQFTPTTGTTTSAFVRCLAWDEANPTAASSETTALKLTVSSVVYASSLRHSVRVLERESHFYVFVFYGMGYRSNLPVPGMIYVLKGTYDDPSTLTLVNSTTLNVNTQTTGMLPITDDYTQVMFDYLGAFPEIYHWNEASETFVLKSTLDSNVHSAMVDSLGRLWYIDSSDAINLQGPSVGSAVRIAFKDNNLEYLGVQVNSEITVSCFNFNGDRVANNVTLQLEGSAAVFSANGSDKITVMTSLAGDVTVPFTVNSNGYIRVIANMAV